MPELETLDTMMKMHIKECDSRDERNTEAMREIKEMFKGIWNAHDEMRNIVTSLQIKAAVAVCVMIGIGKVLDYVVAFLK